MSAALSDLSRRLENLIGLGTIAEVDHAGRRVRLTLSGRLTGWLPYPADIGANFRRWRPLRVGTQVLAACPSGDPANAVIVQILYTDALPPPETDGAVDTVQWDDGTRIRYDSAAHVLTVVTPGDVDVQADRTVTAKAGGDVTVEAGGVATITAQTLVLTTKAGGAGAARMTGSFRLTGDLDVQGTITATGSILAGGANSNHHTH